MLFRSVSQSLREVINMKMDKVAGSGNDEFYTPVYAITPLIKYLKDKGFKKILCPFDTKDSKIYKVLLSEGFEVEHLIVPSNSP